ncbi:MAG TPA: barstar family protein [Kofleriaceae bacterium]|nr:barstar family protein [Kofleriaceae bacterium]
MKALEIDLSRVTTARDIHVAFSTALQFPDWYGHNWDAFWDLVSSDSPLPAKLTIRGLDHVERVLPDEATKMLRCFADYNSESGRGCAVSVTDDYSAPLFFLQYEARPTARLDGQDLGGAFVNCWIKAKSARDANEIAIALIGEDGWSVISHEEVGPTSLATASENDAPFVAQACVDGAVFDYHTWPVDEDDEDNDAM